MAVPLQNEVYMIADLLNAGEALSHIRAEICKALRADAAMTEIQALLRAETLARHALAEVLTREDLFRVLLRNRLRGAAAYSTYRQARVNRPKRT